MIGFVVAVLAQTAAVAEPVDPRTPIQRANAEMMARHYPKGALKRGEEGTVGVSVFIDQRGYPGDCRVTKSSGYRDLDEATCEVIALYGKTRPFTDEGRKVAKTHDGQFAWTLPAGVARAKVADANRQSAKAGDKLAANSLTRIICRSQTRTGSLAERRRVCMTAGEWAQQRDASQSDTKDMQHMRRMDAN